MSRRKREKLSPSQAMVARTLGPLEGARVPGGCDYCDACQVVEPVSAGVWSIGVHHDDDCPFLRSLEARADQ